MAPGREDLRRKLDRLGEISRDLDQRGNKEIAETMTLEALPGGKAMAKEAGDQMFVFRKSHHAVAQIAGGSMLNPRRSLPLEPPSSVTVTTAERSEIRQGASPQSAEEGCGDTT